MKYEDLYNSFKKAVPEALQFFEQKEKENLIDVTDGIHTIFGMVVVPYILYIIQDRKIPEIEKCFGFLESMAMCEEIKIKEVLDFTVLEHLADEGQNVLEECKHYMGIETMKHCEAVEEYFWG